MNKTILRAIFLEKRKTLSIEEHALRSERITSQALEFIQAKKPKTVHLFMPIERQREVDTSNIFEFLKSSSQYNVVLPKVDYEKNELIHVLLEKDTEIVKGKFGIPEPKSGRCVRPNEIDLVFVPLINFDLEGNRIGYGGGYYDKFLSLLPKSSHKVGLSLSPPLDLIPYTEHYDVKLDFCINHHHCYEF